MAGLTLVDLGSGYGVAAELISGICGSALGWPEPVEVERYIAVDSSPELLDRAVSRARNLGIEAHGYRFNLDTREGTSPPPGVGDIVLLAFVLSHLAGVDRGLSLAARAAKDSGIVVAVDIGYALMTAQGNDALVATVNAIQRRLRHRDFADLDSIARSVGLRRLSGLNDVEQLFGPGELSPKHDALSFVANFDPNDPARVAWQSIRGGTLNLTHIRRAYLKDPGLAHRFNPRGDA